MISDIDVSENCWVKQKKGTIRQAIVLETRFSETKNTQEFYVHYDSTDHRLDEWVASDSIESSVPHISAVTEAHPLKRTRTQKRSFDDTFNLASSSSSVDVKPEKVAKVKKIERVVYGSYSIETWYHSPYPKEYEDANLLFICDYCLKYMMYDYTYVKHRQDCRRMHPPGKEIYRDGHFALYEVHGNHARAKVKEQRSNMVGYFSKEIGNVDDYNLACICILPPFQRTGYGKLLIQFSYELSRREGIVGSPEKPLSDLGKFSYFSYWSWVLLETLKETKKITLEELSKVTGIHQDDIVDCLNHLRMTRLWKGTPHLRITEAAIDKCYQNGLVKKPRLVLKPYLLNWKPPNQK